MKLSTGSRKRHVPGGNVSNSQNEPKLINDGALASQLEFEKSRPYEGLDYDVTDDEQESSSSSEEEDAFEQDVHVESALKKARLLSKSGDALHILEKAEEMYEAGQGTVARLLNKLEGKDASSKSQGIALTQREKAQQHIVDSLKNNTTFQSCAVSYQSAAAAVEIDIYSKSSSKMTYQSNLSNTVRAIKKTYTASEIAALSEWEGRAANPVSITEQLSNVEMLAKKRGSTAAAVKLLQKLAMTPINVECISEGSNGKRLKKLTNHEISRIAEEAAYTMSVWKQTLLIN